MRELVDDLDIAWENAEKENAAALAAHTAKANSRVPLMPNGECHYCYSKVRAGELYCDDECRCDHVEELEKMERRNR
jgi:hypothetical protein